MILFTLNEKTIMYKRAFGYLLTALFVALFGAVYEYFGHGVYSYFMIYAFAIPLVLGAVPFMAMGLFEWIIPSDATVKLWGCGVATLTIGSLMRGVLDIYGTTNKLMIVYPVAAAVLFIAAAVKHMAKAKVPAA